ncbi:MAG: hypothetical protein ACRDTV_00565, partial [Mycobacterium sp.]
LGMGRATGFQIAQDARQGSYAPGGSLDAQLDALIGQLVSATARPALQLQNFGMVVDDIGGCRHAWTQAILAAHGQGDGPAHAMAACGAPQAFAHAQQLGANDFVLGLAFLFAAFWIGLFIWYVGISTLLVGAKATSYCIIVVPAAMIGMTGWRRGKQFAIRCASQVLLHGVEMIIFTVFLALSAEGMGWTLTTPQLGHGGMTVVPRLLLTSLGCVVGIFLFHYIDKHFYTDGLGTIAHHISSAWGSGRDAVRDEYNDYADAGRRARSLFNRVRGGRGDTDNGNDTDAASQGAGEQSPPGFDVVKPRPRRIQPEGSPSTATHAAGRAAGRTGAEEAAGAAGEVAAEGATAAAAEGAAAVAAPEVVIPAVIAAKGVEHVRSHRGNTAANGAGGDPNDGHGARTDPGPGGEPGWAPATDHPAQETTADAPPALPSVGRRAPRTQSVRRQGTQAATPDQDPDLQPTFPAIDEQPVEADHSAVEFSSPPRPQPKG